MPLDEQRTLGAHLVDLTRALLFELYERLAMAGFDDLSVDTAGILKDVERDGSTLADLAQRTQAPPDHVRATAERLHSCGYATIDGDCVRLTERGWAAVGAGHQALTQIEESWAHAFGEDRFRAFATMLDELVAWHAFGASPSAASD